MSVDSFVCVCFFFHFYAFFRRRSRETIFRRSRGWPISDSTVQSPPIGSFSGLASVHAAYEPSPQLRLLRNYCGNIPLSRTASCRGSRAKATKRIPTSPAKQPQRTTESRVHLLTRKKISKRLMLILIVLSEKSADATLNLPPRKSVSPR